MKGWEEEWRMEYSHDRRLANGTFESELLTVLSY